MGADAAFQGGITVQDVVRSRPRTQLDELAPTLDDAAFRAGQQRKVDDKRQMAREVRKALNIQRPTTKTANVTMATLESFVRHREHAPKLVTRC